MLNHLESFLLTLFLMLTLNACVTTRAELNEKKAESPEVGVTGSLPESTVKSEEIQKDAKQAIPEVVSKPEVPASVPASSSEAGSYQVEELRAQVASLTGKVEELEHEKQINDSTHAEEVKKLQAQIEEMEKKLKTNEGPAVPAGKDAFEAGKDAYFAEHYAEAVEFLDQYLKDEHAKSVEEATYIRGEAQFKLKNYKKAIIDFSTFPEKYQKSSYHPKALLRISESFEEMGRKDDAKAFYSDLAEKFPKTAEGKLAKKRLKKK